MAIQEDTCDHDQLPNAPRGLREGCTPRRAARPPTHRAQLCFTPARLGSHASRAEERAYDTVPGSAYV
jgi:hypothetical protein